MKNTNDFYKVSLKSNTKRNYLFWFLLIISFISFMVVVRITSDVQRNLAISGISGVIANVCAFFVFALYVFILVFV